MYKILKNIIEMDDYSVQKLSKSQPPIPFEWNTVEGTELNVSDCIGGKGKIAVKGNTYQKQLSGKNFFDVSDVIDVTDGITVDEDGWITVSFNNTGSSNKFFNFYTKVSNLLQTSRAYSIITEIKNVSGNGTLYSVTNTTNMSQSSENVSYNFTSLSNNNKYKNIFTTVSDFTNATTMIRTVLRFSAGQNGSITFRLSVLEDTEMSVDSFEYEPYCGGQASPNPDYPQPIKVVTGNNVINHVGKNLLNKDGTFTNKYIDDNGVSHPENIGATFDEYISCYPNTDYIYHANTSVRNLAIIFYDKNKNFIQRNIARNANSNQVISPNNAKYILLSVSYNATDTVTQDVIDNLDLQLEEDSATEYEPYKENAYQLNLGNIELCKIGDYEDVLFKNVAGDENYNAELESGAGYKKKVIDKVVLDGTWGNVSINTSSTNTTRAYFTNVQEKAALSITVAPQISEQIICASINSVDVEGGYAGSNKTTVLRLNKSRAGTTKQEINDYLSQNNIVIWFVLQEPVYEKITDTTLISQLEALNKFKWFKGVNHIWTETDNLDPVLKGTYRQAINE